MQPLCGLFHELLWGQGAAAMQAAPGMPKPWLERTGVHVGRGERSQKMLLLGTREKGVCKRECGVTCPCKPG